MASRLGEQVAAQARGAFVGGFHDALLIAAATVAASAVVVGWLLKAQTSATSSVGHHESQPDETQRIVHTDMGV
ncbi:hypothetical protein [Kineococcus arenarius]|uniref:hypothetical protein n=1 Tax=unclassified Kineococcus TaxID=2621656 RepID=UPI003D7C8BD4